MTQRVKRAERHARQRSRIGVHPSDYGTIGDIMFILASLAGEHRGKRRAQEMERRREILRTQAFIQQRVELISHIKSRRSAFVKTMRTWLPTPQPHITLSQEAVDALSETRVSEREK